MIASPTQMPMKYVTRAFSRHSPPFLCKGWSYSIHYIYTTLSERKIDHKFRRGAPGENGVKLE